MNTYIYGAGKAGSKFYSLNILEVTGFIDKYKNGSLLGLEIYKIEEVPHNSKIIIAIMSIKNAASIYRDLSSMGFHNLWWYNGEGDNYTSCVTWERGVLEQVEMHIVDYCNLNCRGCTHFSPLFDRKKLSMSDLIDNVKKLREKVGMIGTFYILGGEPFLSRDLGKCVVDIREILPTTRITIVTNGLLIPSAKDDILKDIQGAGVTISISEYAPTKKYIVAIKDTLDAFNIQYSIRSNETKEKFNLPLTVSGNTCHEKLCISKNCVIIANGLIARCPTLMYISKFNDYFKQELPSEGIISLDGDLSGWDLVDFLTEQVKLCDYCIEYPVKWEQCSKPPNLTDFAVLD